MRQNSFSLSRWIGVTCAVLSLTFLSLGQNATAAQKSSATTATTAVTPAAAQTIVPQLIKFSGTLTDLAGKPISGAVDVTFSLYSQQDGGTPLWYESQTVNANAAGEYTTLLGAMTATGVPMDLFTSGQARWLGVAVRGLPEQSRILLVSVPYAMTSGNSEMLGGKPAADYLLASQSGTGSTTTAAVVGTSSTSTTNGRSAKQTTTASPQSITAGGTANFLAAFVNSTGTLGNSNVFQNPTTNDIGIGTTAPTSLLNVGAPAVTPGSGKFTIAAPTAAITPSGALPAGTVTTALWLEGNYASLNDWTRGVALELGTGSTRWGHYSSRLVDFSNPFATVGTRLQLQTHSVKPDVWNTGLFMNEAGNVGVGTTAPLTRMEIAGPLNTTTPETVLDLSRGYNAGIAWMSAASFLLSNPAIGVHNTRLDIALRNANHSSDVLPDTTVMSLVSNGNVGIGTTAPTTKLDVNGTITAASFNGAVLGGAGNSANTGSGATVAGGQSNIADSVDAAVGGGFANSAIVAYATVAGGDANTALGQAATVAGGENNTANGGFSTVGGGDQNFAASKATTVAGGTDNAANGTEDTVSGGGGNGTNGGDATIAGGFQNVANQPYSSIGGGNSNAAEGSYATVGGGYTNTASGEFATVAGGDTNQATGLHSTVGGGNANQALGDSATVAGGDANQAAVQFAAVGGGNANQALGDNTTIAGGKGNLAQDLDDTVGGGENNLAQGEGDTIAGGFQNTAAATNSSGTTAFDDTIGGGFKNEVSAAQGATVPGGYDNAANGNFSFAAGCQATANNNGSFVWNGSGTTSSNTCGAALSDSGPGVFIAMAPGGVAFVTNTAETAGVQLAAGGGSWSSLSDRNMKTGVKPVDGEALLAKLNRIPMNTWSYKTQKSSIRHMGPMAQDLYAAFHLGESNKAIDDVDGQGVALAGVQALYRLSLAKDEKIAELTAQNHKLAQASKAKKSKLAKLSRQNRKLVSEVARLQKEASAVEALEARLNRDEARNKATRTKLARVVRQEKKNSRTELARMQF